MLYFENDYCEGAHPAILQKLTETNFEKVSGYGTDPYCASAREKIPPPRPAPKRPLPRCAPNLLTPNGCGRSSSCCWTTPALPSPRKTWRCWRSRHWLPARR